MFIKSTKQKQYTYKVVKVFKSKQNERPFTIISLYEKQKEGYLYADVIVWEELNVKEGDLIAFYDISAVSFEEKDKGYAIYKTLKITSSQIKVIKENWKMSEELERQLQEQDLEEKLTNDEMLHDEELELESKKDKLENDIKSIKLQLMTNKELECRQKGGEEVEPKGEVWILKARQALLIKKSQLKKINKKLANIKALLYGGK